MNSVHPRKSLVVEELKPAEKAQTSMCRLYSRMRHLPLDPSYALIQIIASGHLLSQEQESMTL